MLSTKYGAIDSHRLGARFRKGILRLCEVSVALFVATAMDNHALEIPDSWCISFDERPVGEYYKVGDVDNFLNLEVRFQEFTWAGGRTTDEGSATVDGIVPSIFGSQISAGGSGQQLLVNNTNVALRLPDGTTHVSLRYGDWGGNVNLSVNGDFVNADTLSRIGDRTIGGVGVKVTEVGRGFHNVSGTLELTNGEIDTLAIGGQEFILDDICLHLQGWIPVHDIGSVVAYNDASVGNNVEIAGHQLMRVGDTLQVAYIYFEESGVSVTVPAERVEPIGSDWRMVYWNPATGERRESISVDLALPAPES